MDNRLFILNFAVLYFCAFLFSTSCNSKEFVLQKDVVIIGGSTGGTAAAIQAARLGTATLLVEPSSWLGGMLTAAGVSATDGNHAMPAGLWGEFRSKLHKHYGGANAVATGWVSNTQFEPSVGAAIFQEMAAAEANLEVWLETKVKSIKQMKDGWEILITKDGKRTLVEAKIIIDGTDLGDVAAAVGASYDLGMDAQSETGEAMAPENANDIIQDFTYAAILKDYGTASAPAVIKPADYRAEDFYCSCQQNCPDTTAHPCETMLSYGKLPNGKYMINWPLDGNDYYAPLVEISEAERQQIYQQAKYFTLGFVYYIQNELGYKNLGLADDEFPTEDKLPFIPYHREGRRIHGLVQLNVNHILQPFEYKLYRTGIAVGDYPIDHHHAKNPDAPEINFPSVPSFNVPMGSLIPKSPDNLLIADKPISVTNIVNGSTRLQPVVLQIGQAAGVLAALAVQQNKSPVDISVREVQAVLLNNNGYLLPYYDVSPEHPHFAAIQRIGATGILKGKGEPWKWANRTWFYPDSLIEKSALQKGLADFDERWDFGYPLPEEPLRIMEARELLLTLSRFKENAIKSRTEFDDYLKENWEKFGLTNYEATRFLTRAELAVLLDEIVQPFSEKDVSIEGNWK